MTKEEIKNILESYKFDNQLLIEKNNELFKLNEQHFKKFEILKPINSKENKDFYEQAIAKYKKQSLIIENEIEKILNKRKLIEGFIEDIDQPYKNVLYFRYIQCLSTEETALRMNYSPQRIYQLHDQGIKLLFKKEDVS